MAVRLTRAALFRVAIAAIASAPTWALAVPAMLVVQNNVPKKNNVDPNMEIGLYLAGELDEDGRVVPIVWSLSDPIFRAAVNERKITNSASPTVEDAIATANKLDCEYILFCTAYRDENTTRTTAEVYKRGRSIWKADRSFNVTVGDVFNPDDTARTIAHTWTALLAQTPLKDLAPKIRPSTGGTPEIPPPLVDVPAPPIHVVENEQLLADLDRLLDEGRGAQAVLMARDAVDSEPMDMERRLALSRTLYATGDYKLAAQEARRGADVLKEAPELRLAAVRAWLASGEFKDAREDANVALAQKFDTPDMLLTLGHLCLAEENPSGAASYFDRLIKDAPNSAAYRGRAMCAALTGDRANTSKFIALAKDPLQGADGLVEYGIFVSILQKLLTQKAEGVRDLFPRALLDRSDPIVVKSGGQTLEWIAGVDTLMAAVAPPKGYENSHERRVLALKLLAQCLSDLNTFLGSGDSDVATDARISLGEVFKEIAASNEVYQQEREQVKEHARVLGI